MKQLYVKPAPDRATPDPENGGQLLPEGGGWVPNTVYWQRRLTDEDVVESEPPSDNDVITPELPALSAVSEVVVTKPTKGSKAE